MCKYCQMLSIALLRCWIYASAEECIFHLQWNCVHTFRKKISNYLADSMINDFSIKAWIFNVNITNVCTCTACTVYTHRVMCVCVSFSNIVQYIWRMWKRIFVSVDGEWKWKLIEEYTLYLSFISAVCSASKR